MFDIFSTEFVFIFPYYVKLLLYYLSSTIHPSTILIAETGGDAPWVHMPLSFQSLHGGLKHACVIHAVAKCKSSAVVDPAVSL